MPVASPGLAGCRLVDLPTLTDERGSLTVAEAELDIPFVIRRVFYLHGVPAGTSRAGHAHREQEQVMLALAGSFEVLLDDGADSRTVRVARPDRGLYVSAMVWQELHDFSPGAVCVVLASTRYREDDYCRDYEEFCRAARLSGR